MWLLWVQSQTDSYKQTITIVKSTFYLAYILIKCQFGKIISDHIKLNSFTIATCKNDLICFVMYFGGYYLANFFSDRLGFEIILLK